ncbi:hypothetical protein [Consotaella aegiceratis]|uniref:hypothetical protein n=1 Tax=Consotaella aegiceratis TaxID=3097961 RepID=UPI002F3F9AC7
MTWSTQSLARNDFVYTTAPHAEPVTLSGTITHVFDDHVVVMTDDGHWLVTIPPGTRPIEAGRSVHVDGECRGHRVTARIVTPIPSAETEPPSETTEWTEDAGEYLPPLLRGLGLMLAGSLDRPCGKTEFWGTTPSGARFEADVEGDRVREIKAIGHRAGLPRGMIDRFVPGGLSRYPLLSAISGLHRIEVDDDGVIVLEGLSSGGRYIEAEISETGQLLRIQRL